MRRFSQKNQLVTLNEINVTPLLDLAFVLLIIFVITRPLLEQSMDLKVPSVGKLTTPQQIQKKDIRTIEIDARGYARYRGRPVSLPDLEQALVTEYRQNPKIVVNIRADKQVPWDAVAQVLGLCMRNGITQVAPQTAAE
jgi:biopolymer transport protein ExbD